MVSHIQQAQQGKGNVAVDAPGEGCIGAQPLVLGHHAQGNAHTGQSVNQRSQTVLPLHMVALPPYIVEQDIEDGHGHRGDPLTSAQGNGVVFQSGGAEGDGTGNQVERVTGAQYHSHDTEQTELGVSLAALDHLDAKGDDGNQIDNVEQSFCNSLHSSISFLIIIHVCFQIAAESALP